LSLWTSIVGLSLWSTAVTIIPAGWLISAEEVG
jgi:uncharacterized protein YbdZ (MbtH family)